MRELIEIDDMVADYPGVEVIPGKHVVASIHGVAIVVANREMTTPTAHLAARKTLAELIRMVQQAAEVRHNEPSRRFVRLATEWLIAHGGDTEFGVMWPSDGRLAVFLHGGITVALVGRRDSVEWLRRADAGFTTDRVFKAPATAAGLFVDDKTATIAVPSEPGAYWLARGVVPGAGLVIWFDRAVSKEMDESKPSKRQRSAGDGDEQATPEAGAVQPPRRKPDPTDGREDADSSGDDRAPARVMGFDCARGHFNEAGAKFCRVCGIRNDQKTAVLKEGDRPALGVLVLDDGESIVLDEDYVLGREPEDSDSVKRGRRPVRLTGASRKISRAHAEVLLVGWSVEIVDLASANGTYVRMRGQNDWSRLAANKPMALTTGVEIAIGDRVLFFDSLVGQF